MSRATLVGVPPCDSLSQAPSISVTMRFKAAPLR